ncbi:hypothetical protein [Montanilutibacter psychrotolerans]|uniref:Uncharacterized protein n=1 Tax=Montanilutibacter psychrotolerans TaxID=1327343 RepID=A0A3M8SZC0_9GAMM|nr:hypothetical protein [Lysobacter psychrotolerans]RNF83882.1 hypothetical protein EER27_11040 [Lysobacter psychrotolerans]
MDKRVLLGSFAAVIVMLMFDLCILLSGKALDLPKSTPLGVIAFGSLVVTFAAMALGAVLAGRRFRWIALAIAALLTAVVMAMLVDTAQRHMDSFAGAFWQVLRYNGMSLLLTLAMAWAGALIGERLAAKRPVKLPG